MGVGQSITSLIAKNGNKENFSNMEIFENNFSEAYMTVGLFLILYTALSQDYEQKSSSLFDQNWRCNGNFCHFCHDGNFCVGQSITLQGGIGQSITGERGGVWKGPKKNYVICEQPLNTQRLILWVLPFPKNNYESLCVAKLMVSNICIKIRIKKIIWIVF